MSELRSGTLASIPAPCIWTPQARSSAGSRRPSHPGGRAKATVSQLVSDGGLHPTDAGALKRAHELEALGYLHMALQQPLGTNFASTVKLLA